MQRWVPSRLIPGRTGTAIGALAALPRLYHAFGWKGKTLLARAVSAGDDPMVRQIIRTAADVWLQDNPDDEEVRKHLEAINEEAR
jgi:hypothetical protein